MLESVVQRRDRLIGILENFDYAEIYEDTAINNAGLVYVSSSQKDNYVGCETIIIVMPNKVKTAKKRRKN